MVGQFRTRARASMAPRAVQTEASRRRARPRRLSEVPWEDARLRSPYPHLVADDMGELDGLVIVDESGVPHTGQAAVGVARQYCGA
jgi:SRSO17 transposase